MSFNTTMPCDPWPARKEIKQRIHNIVISTRQGVLKAQTTGQLINLQSLQKSRNQMEERGEVPKLIH